MEEEEGVGEEENEDVASMVFLLHLIFSNNKANSDYSTSRCCTFAKEGLNMNTVRVDARRERRCSLCRSGHYLWGPALLVMRDFKKAIRCDLFLYLVRPLFPRARSSPSLWEKALSRGRNEFDHSDKEAFS